MADGQDRRRAPRHDTMGVIVHAALHGESQAAGLYTIGDLSPLGALLQGSTRLPDGVEVDLTLEIPGDRSVEIRATVARCFGDEGDIKVGVQFGEVSKEATALIQEILLSEMVRSTDPIVLVVAGGVSQAIDLWADLDEVGCDARVVPSLDEGFIALHARDLPVSTILVDIRTGASNDTVAFAQYAQENMPKARLLFFGVDDAASPMPGVECVSTSEWSLENRQSLFRPSQVAPIRLVTP
ncbi:MAG: hypothetical protein ACJATT_003729 [Myxococcota bacterium]|jgi:hypothetical protein